MATAREVAEHLDLSDRSVRDLQKRGIVPQAAPGELSLDACRVAYIRHMREQAAGRAGAEGKDEKNQLASQKARLAAEQADAAAMKNAIARGEMVPISAVTRAVLTVIEVSKARLAKVPAIAAKGDAALRERIATALQDAMEDLSTTRVEAVMGEGAEGDEEPDAPDGDDDAG